jgi:hypothetical protein
LSNGLKNNFNSLTLKIRGGETYVFDLVGRTQQNTSTLNVRPIRIKPGAVIDLT